MKNYQNLKFCPINPVWFNIFKGKMSGSINLKSSNELVRILNKVRSSKGFTDLVDVKTTENKVDYQFSLIFDTYERNVKIMGFVNGAERDSFGFYSLPMSEEEKQDVILQLINKLAQTTWKGAHTA